MKTPRLLKAIVVITVFLITVNAQAKIIADYQKDYKAPEPKVGWAYQWNPKGVKLGSSAGYEDLHSPPSKHFYAVGSKSEDAFSVDMNGVWIKISRKSILPGRPESKSSDQISHYAIIAYTVQAGEAGEAQIVNSQIKRILIAGNERPPSPISIYVNDRLIGADQVEGYEAFAFDVPLGNLKVGDTVYIAYGCPTDSNPSSATLQFQIKVGK